MSSSPLAAFHRANAFTYASLAAAVGAVAAATHGDADGTGALVAVAVIADTFDGRFARLFERSDTERAFGAQLDSLADAIAFGAAPAVCTMLLGPAARGVELLWWLAAVLFAACAITRLAFFNVTHEIADGFVGLPAPVAALIWSSSLLAHPTSGTSAAVLACLAAAMVLPVRIPRPRGVALALFTLWPVAVMLAHSAARCG
jgi:CDP-diacylglycerol---serine O-phosphatidyltransferase